jgi:hypothetical protein
MKFRIKNQFLSEHETLCICNDIQKLSTLNFAHDYVSQPLFKTKLIQNRIWKCWKGSRKIAKRQLKQTNEVRNSPRKIKPNQRINEYLASTVEIWTQSQTSSRWIKQQQQQSLNEMHKSTVMKIFPCLNLSEKYSEPRYSFPFTIHPLVAFKCISQKKKLISIISRGDFATAEKSG